MKQKDKKESPKPSKGLSKHIVIPNDEPVHLDMSFKDAIKLALNTPIKKKK